ncbi:MAG: NfeD family protein [Ignavibacteriales bacterium]|nr:NfeD family protein [Ignavibacteriales bacterium]
MFESFPSELVWFIFGLIFILAELMLPGFVIIFFGIGAWFTALLNWVGFLPSFTSQLFCFLVSSVLSLVLFRKKATGILRGKITGKLSFDEELDNVKGQKVRVVVEIKPDDDGGKVELFGTIWNAEADVPIPQGTMVEVVERKNLILKVKPIQ